MYGSFGWDEHLLLCLLVTISPLSPRETCIYLWGNHSSYSEPSVPGRVDFKPSSKVWLPQNYPISTSCRQSGCFKERSWPAPGHFSKALILLILFVKTRSLSSAVVADRIRPELHSMHLFPWGESASSLWWEKKRAKWLSHNELLI